MANIKQHDDGSASFFNDIDGAYGGRHGGPATGSVSAPAYRAAQWVEFACSGAVSTAGGVFAWRPDDQSRSHLITRLVLDVTTKSTGAATLDIGVAADATTLNDTLIDGLSVAATGTFDNIENQGTNGVSAKKIAAGSYVTASMASGDPAGMVATVYVEYVAL
jgi:hypothetical protein